MRRESGLGGGNGLKGSREDLGGKVLKRSRNQRIKKYWALKKDSPLRKKTNVKGKMCKGGKRGAFKTENTKGAWTKNYW